MTVEFTISSPTAHALLAEQVFARGRAAGIEAPDEFAQSDAAPGRLIMCCVPMARFILKELRRMEKAARYDVEFRTTMGEAASTVERAIAARVP